MNDQRQVIFSQRLRILNEASISKILSDFFEEILKDLEVSRINFQKSNDEKYLTEIKNITGNSLNDEELKKLMSRDRDGFIKELKELFTTKQKSRINILGEYQNKSLEKKNISTNHRFCMEIASSIFRTA